MSFDTSIKIEHAKKGANSDITSLSGLTTPLTVGQGGTGQANIPAEIGVACSDESTPIVTTGTKATLSVPRDMRITEVKASLTTAEATGYVKVDVKYHATVPGSAATIFNDSTALTIASDDYYNTLTGANFASAASFYDVAENGIIKVSVESTAPVEATGLKVWFIGYWT